MRTVMVMALSTVLFSSVASAQQNLSPLSTRAVISAQDCQRLIQHIPNPDVAYKPGVDVHGKPVAPADLPSTGGGFNLPDHIEFNFSINPTNYGLTSTQAAQKSQLVTGNNSQLPVAKITYDFATGAMTINGKPLVSADQQAVAAECRKKGMN